jgi:hypothetical protein
MQTFYRFYQSKTKQQFFILTQDVNSLIVRMVDAPGKSKDQWSVDFCLKFKNYKLYTDFLGG